ncbi:hypothetical protein SNEBB_009269 [Seison nebaliae]|nr:hypothetical protein SNEBB_009269 [Seison nebaliae]
MNDKPYDVKEDDDNVYITIYNTIIDGDEKEAQLLDEGRIFIYSGEAVREIRIDFPKELKSIQFDHSDENETRNETKFVCEKQLKNETYLQDDKQLDKIYFRDIVNMNSRGNYVSFDDDQWNIDWSIEMANVHQLEIENLGFNLNYLMSEVSTILPDFLQINRTKRQEWENEMIFKKFSADHYLSDLTENKEEINRLLRFNYMKHFDLPIFSYDDQCLTERLGRRCLLVTNRNLNLLFLVEILLCFTYHNLVNECQQNEVMSQDIVHLSSMLSYLLHPTTLNDVLSSFMINSLTFVIYRSWDLSIHSMHLLPYYSYLDKSFMLNILVEIHKQFISNDLSYLNKLFIDDFICWVNSTSFPWKQFQHLLQSIPTEANKLHKNQFSQLHLIELENVANDVMSELTRSQLENVKI